MPGGHPTIEVAVVAEMRQQNYDRDGMGQVKALCFGSATVVGFCYASSTVAATNTRAPVVFFVLPSTTVSVLIWPFDAAVWTHVVL